jgi:hypothetical protein
MRPMPAAHGPNAAFVSRPTRFQGRQVSVKIAISTMQIYASLDVERFPLFQFIKEFIWFIIMSNTICYTDNIFVYQYQAC